MKLLRGRGILVGLVAVFAVLAANTALTLHNLRRLHTSSDRLVEASSIALELSDLLAALTTMQAHQRGYVILGSDASLVPFEQARIDLEAQLDQLERLLDASPGRKTALGSVRESITTAASAMQQTVQARQEDGFDSAQALIATGRVQGQIDAALSRVKEMQRGELRNLSHLQSEAHVSYWLSLATTLLSTLLGAVLLLMGYFTLRRDLQNREEGARALQEANERLEDRVRERTATLSETNATLRDEVDTRRVAENLARQFAAELQRSNRELEQFASVASHDLQEPLRKIQAFGDRLRSRATGLDERANEYLERMLSSAGRMRTLIDDLLTYSRVSTRAHPYAQVNLNEVAGSVVSDLEGRLQQTGGRVELGELPTIEAEPVQMRQLLLNLIGNALKFRRPEVPPVVRVSGRKLPLHATAGGSPDGAELCEIEVSDNGIGFEPQYADRIFELFQRLHSRHDYEGTGMGLAICRKIVERHGGSIHAFSEPGAGSRFVVTLPVLQPAVKGVDV